MNVATKPIILYGFELFSEFTPDAIEYVLDQDDWFDNEHLTDYGKWFCAIVDGALYLTAQGMKFVMDYLSEEDEG